MGISFGNTPLTEKEEITAELCKYLTYNVAADEAVVRDYIEKGADISIRVPGYQSFQGGTVLTEAAKRKHLDIIKMLLEKGSPIDLADKSGYTPVFYASEPEMMKELLKWNPDLHHKNFQELTSFRNFVNNWRYDVACMLLEHDTSLAMDTDKNGEHIIETAARHVFFEGKDTLLTLLTTEPALQMTYKHLAKVEKIFQQATATNLSFEKTERLKAKWLPHLFELRVTNVVAKSLHSKNSVAKKLQFKKPGVS